MESIIQFVQAEANGVAGQLVLEKLANLSSEYDWGIRTDFFWRGKKLGWGGAKFVRSGLAAPVRGYLHHPMRNVLKPQ